MPRLNREPVIRAALPEWLRVGLLRSSRRSPQEGDQEVQEGQELIVEAVVGSPRMPFEARSRFRLDHV